MQDPLALAEDVPISSSSPSVPVLVSPTSTLFSRNGNTSTSPLASLFPQSPTGATTAPAPASDGFFGALKANPIFSAGAGIAGIGVGLGIARQAALAGMRIGEKYFTISIELVSKDRAYGWVLQWLGQQTRVQRSMTSQHVGVETTFTQQVGGHVNTRFDFVPSSGAHSFWYRKRLISIRRERERQMVDMNSGTPWETLTLRAIGRDRTLFVDLLNEAKAYALQRTEGKTIIYTSMGMDWRQFGQPRNRRPLESVILDKGISGRILNDLLEFSSSQQWYLSRGIPYRRGYLLYGPPGTGKSSFIMALAGHCQYNICVLNLNERGLTDDKLAYLLSTIPPRSIILLEDIDAAFRGDSREAHAASIHVTFSGLLNALDGVASTEERIVFMTTNHVDRLDEALVRPGRVDVRQEISHATPYQIEGMFERFYPSKPELLKKFMQIIKEKEISNISIAELQGLFLLCKDDPEAAVSMVPELKASTKDRSKAIQSSSRKFVMSK